MTWRFFLCLKCLSIINLDEGEDCCDGQDTAGKHGTYTALASERRAMRRGVLRARER